MTDVFMKQDAQYSEVYIHKCFF